MEGPHVFTLTVSMFVVIPIKAAWGNRDARAGQGHCKYLATASLRGRVVGGGERPRYYTIEIEYSFG